MGVPAAAVASLVTMERLALARAAAGVSGIVRPTMLPRLLGVGSAAATRTSWVVQMLGAREIALGLGTWAALRQGNARATRLWLLAGLVTDGIDGVVIAAAAAKGRVSRLTGTGVAAIAGTAVYAQAEALRELEEG